MIIYARNLRLENLQACTQIILTFPFPLKFIETFPFINYFISLLLIRSLWLCFFVRSLIRICILFRFRFLFPSRLFFISILILISYQILIFFILVLVLDLLRNSFCFSWSIFNVIIFDLIAALRQLCYCLLNRFPSHLCPPL